MKIRILVVVVTLAAVCAAQTGTGTVQGTVLDASRSAMPGAKVTLTHQGTNVARRAETSAVGFFSFGSVPPGPYKIEVEAQGFKKWASSLALEVGQTAALEPLLDVGAVETVIEVADSTPVMTTVGMEISDVKDARRIEQLPLNGRSITTLFNLTPGVEGGGNPRVNGLKVGSVEMLLDGVSLVDRFGGGIQRVQPSVDTIQEFRIETVGSSARYSRPATVTLVTKSGTNTLHGALFETHRNNRGGLRARQRQDGNIPAKLIRNEFGGSASGPVWLPKLYNGKDRTFWFFSYEALRQRTDTFQRDVVPTAAMWEGNFNAIFDNNNRQTHIYDPLTTNAQGVRTQFPGNIVGRSRIHSFYGVMQSVTSVPTNANNPYQDINMERFYNTVTSFDLYTTKIDHRFSANDSVTGRFSRNRRFFSQVGGRFGSPTPELRDGFGTGRSESRIYLASINHTHLFTPNFLSELLVAVNRAPHGNGTLADFTDWPARLGLPNPFGVTGWPTLGTEQFGWDSDNRHNQHLTSYTLEPNLSWVRGKHTVKFGGKVRYEYSAVRELQQAQGSHTFGTAWTSLYNPSGDQAVSFTGVGQASMALGLPTFLFNQYNRGYFYFEQQEVGAYVHDSWKVTPRLTLDLGVRWDKWTAYEEKFNRLANVDVDNFIGRFEVVTPKNVRMEDLPGVPPSTLASWAARGLRWKTAREAGLPDSLVRGDNNNFGPRIGAAYRLTDRMVLRGGYGEYFWTMPLAQILQTSRTNPPLNLRYTNQIGSLDGTSTFAVRTVPRQDFFVGRAAVDTQGIIFIPITAQSMMPWDAKNWKDGRAQSWHFTVEREVMANTALRLSYIGDHGRDMEQRYSVNGRESEFNYQARTGQIRPAVVDRLRPNPDWALRAANRTGYSNTHTLQAEVERRYSNGLAFQWFYVFTRSKTTSDAGGFTSGNGSINSTDGQFEVPENVQILGAPSLTYDQRLRLGYQNSVNIPAQRVRWNGIYDLPFGRGKRVGRDSAGLLNHLIGGWQVATIGEWRGGNWFSVGSGGYLFGDPTLSPDQRLLLTFNNRPQRLWFRGDFDPTRATNVDRTALTALVPVDRGARVYHPVGTGFDNRIPQRLADGSTRLTSITDMVNWNPRAFFLGPGAWNADVALFKNITISERVRARFTADFFNFFNHPVDVNPNATTGLQDLSVQGNDPRIIQFSLRFSF